MKNTMDMATGPIACGRLIRLPSVQSRLVAELNVQFEELLKLEAAIKANLKGLGYGR